MSDKLCLDLDKRIDNDGRAFYIARLKAPVLIDAKDGVVFLVFVSEEGAEQVQICPMTSKRDRNAFNDNGK